MSDAIRNPSINLYFPFPHTFGFHFSLLLFPSGIKSSSLYLTSISNAEIFISMGKKGGGEREKRGRRRRRKKGDRVFIGNLREIVIGVFVGSCGFLLLFYHSRTCLEGGYTLSIKGQAFCQ